MNAQRAKHGTNGGAGGRACVIDGFARRSTVASKLSLTTQEARRIVTGIRCLLVHPLICWGKAGQTV
jgi:hypothetical protein